MQIGIDEIRLVGEFTYRFQRLERTVVDRNFLVPKRKFPTPDWQQYFVSTLDQKFKALVIDGKFPELKKPLKKRIVDNGKIVSREVAGESKLPLEYLIKIDFVRDNLFHGTKALDDKNRDIDLLTESISFLKIIEGVDEAYSKAL